MDDEVHNPKHYNVQGIEVIEVIEAYELPYHLGNVIKYILRHQYKGKPLQDLKKAQWYLNRHIEGYEATIACGEWEADPANAEWTTDEDYIGPGYSPREVEVFFQGYDCRKQEEDEEVAEALADESFHLGAATTKIEVDPGVPLDYSYFHSSRATRIAGEDEAAQKIKDEYYKFDRYEIQGYCANCDAEIAKGQPYIKDNSFDADLKFCKSACAKRFSRAISCWLKDWTP